ncbi:MAG: tetratricopeptide repeat protein [Magnetococcales bacterium]|nr:tetratricopeptide repeat protein [Magnetococcales bacterium]
MSDNHDTSISSDNQGQLTVADAYMIAVEHVSAERFGEADRLCTAIVQAVPNHIDALNLLGIIGQKLNRHDLAVEQFQRAIAVDSSGAVLYYNLATSLYPLGRREEAIEALQTALEKSPGDIQITEYLKAISNTSLTETSVDYSSMSADDLLKKGVALHQSGMVDEALKLYRRSLEIQPLQASAHSNIGVILQSQGKLDDAVFNFKKAIKIQPDYTQAYNNLGAVLQEQNRFDEAVFNLEKAIAVSPKYAEAYNNLGNVKKAQGKFEEAMVSYQQATDLMPEFVQAHYNLGTVLQKQGRVVEAVESYQKALSIHPDLAEAHYNLGIIHQEQGDMDKAVASCQKAIAIKPGFAEAHCVLGTALQREGKLEEAAACQQRAISIKPGYAEAYISLGIVQKEQGNLAAAIASYQKAITIKPNYPEAYNNLGNTLKEQDRLNEAISNYQKAIAIKANYAEAYRNLGAAFQEQGCLDAAVEACQKAISIKPDYAEAYYIIGNSLMEQMSLDAAVENYQKAIAIKPDYPDAYCNLGNARNKQAKIEEAVNSYQKAIALKPNHAEAHFNLSTNLLLIGDYESGWKEYEYRFLCREVSYDNYQQPRWDGSRLDGKTILLHHEQGFGDTLQCIRYVELVKNLGATVIVYCQKPLGSLLQGMEHIDKLCTSTDSIPAFDCQLPLFSLPLLFGTTLETIPENSPYIYPDQLLVKKFSQRLEGVKGFKVGIVWQGSPRHNRNWYRSVDPAILIKLFSIEGAVFISLQKEAKESDLELLSKQDNFIDISAELNDFSDTAAAMANLDLMISVDTSVVHLSGALACPSWVMLSYIPDWRWLLEGEDSPWYPSARLFRQSKHGNWDSVIESVFSNLTNLVKGENPGL